MARRIAVREQSDEKLSTTVVEAVANLKGVDTLDLPPLYHAIEPDALDSLYADSRARTPERLEFVYADCIIEVADEPDEGMAGSSAKSAGDA